MNLKDLERHFFHLYGRRNRIFLSGLRERIDFLTLAISDLQEAIRKDHGTKILEIALARVVSRIFCISENFYSLPFMEMLIRKYPAGHCSYCHRFPCSCPESRLNPKIEEFVSVEQLNWSLTGWCQYFGTLYGERNKQKGIENLMNRLFKEIGELLSLQMRLPTLGGGLDFIEEEFALELADTLAWTIAIANFFGINLEEAVLSRYGERCGTCQRVPCECTHFNVEPVRWGGVL